MLLVECEISAHPRLICTKPTNLQSSRVGLPLSSSLLLEYSSEYLNEYSSTR